MNYELEDMRQQMATLKKKLEQQEIVNDRIIRQSMKKNANNINRRYYFVIAIGLLMIPYGYWVFVMLSGYSLAFWIGTSIFMLICSGATFYNMRNIREANMMHNNLIDVRKKMARAKKFDSNWLFFGMPMIVAWLGWLIYEIYQKDADAAKYMILACTIGVIVGAVIGFTIHMRSQHDYQEIIDQIEDITNLTDDATD